MFNLAELCSCMSLYKSLNCSIWRPQALNAPTLQYSCAQQEAYFLKGNYGRVVSCFRSSTILRFTLRWTALDGTSHPANPVLRACHMTTCPAHRCTPPEGRTTLGLLWIGFDFSWHLRGPSEGERGCSRQASIDGLFPSGALFLGGLSVGQVRCVQREAQLLERFLFQLCIQVLENHVRCLFGNHHGGCVEVSAHLLGHYGCIHDTEVFDSAEDPEPGVDDGVRPLAHPAGAGRMPQRRGELPRQALEVRVAPEHLLLAAREVPGPHLGAQGAEGRRVGDPHGHLHACGACKSSSVDIAFAKRTGRS